MKRTTHWLTLTLLAAFFTSCGGGGPKCGSAEDCESGVCGPEGACLEAVCGDGVVNAEAEECDDGNGDDSDDCLSNCRLAHCGDGIPHGFLGEECDDGNDDDTDTCLSTCVAATCGDGHVQEGVESCDDGNDDDTDACLSTCVSATCGDAIVQDGEACDDGNEDETDACLSTCLAASCGDGYVQGGVEECDGDGAGVGGETAACDVDCTFPSCGDGTTNAAAGEACDDGNEDETDDCLTNCMFASCGDGLVHAGVEECDGNGTGGAGETPTCDVDCTIATCGDGVRNVSADEMCDDGNDDNTDGCLDTCVTPSCGDGYVQAGVEVCDGDGLGNPGQTATCDVDCTVPVCGDGIRNALAGEGCDDGNSVDFDDCANDCTANPPATLDQSYPYDNADPKRIGFGGSGYQTFTAGVTGTLTTFVWWGGLNGCAEFVFTIYEGTGTGGTALGSFSSSGCGKVSVPMTTAIPMVDGSAYTFGFERVSGHISASYADAYPGCADGPGGFTCASSPYDVHFQTFVR